MAEKLGIHEPTLRAFTVQPIRVGELDIHPRLKRPPDREVPVTFNMVDDDRGEKADHNKHRSKAQGEPEPLANAFHSRVINRA